MSFSRSFLRPKLNSPQASGLIAWFPTLVENQRFDDLIGSLGGELGSGNGWELNADIGRMLSFDGTSNSTFTVGTFDPPAAGSFTCWLKCDSSTNRQRVFGFADAFELRVESDTDGDLLGADIFAAGALSLESSGAFAGTGLHHVAVTWNLSTNDLKLYIDGELDNSNSNADDDPGSGSLSIGTRTGSVDYYGGVLADLRFYEGELDESVIREMAGSGRFDLLGDFYSPLAVGDITIQPARQNVTWATLPATVVIPASFTAARQNATWATLPATAGVSAAIQAARQNAIWAVLAPTVSAGVVVQTTRQNATWAILTPVVSTGLDVTVQASRQNAVWAVLAPTVGVSASIAATRLNATWNLIHPAVYLPTAIPHIPYRSGAEAATYTIWLSSPTGTRIKLIDTQTDVLRLEYVRVVNQPGVLVMRLEPNFPLSYIQEDSRLEVLRKLPSGLILDTDTIWLIRDWDDVTTERGEEFIEVTAYSAMELLDRRIVAYAASSSQASKSSDYVDDIMKAVVRENLGSLATDADRDISDWLTVESDKSLGPTTSKSFSRKRVLSVLKDLGLEALNAGTPVYFDIDGGLVFRTFVNQRGINHGQASGQRVTLASHNGTLTDIRHSYRSSEERNYIYVGGQGQESNRTVVTASDSDRIAISPFNRRELWVDGRNNDSGDLAAEADAALSEWRPRRRLTAKVTDTPALRYGRDWNFGDKVVTHYKSLVADAQINEVRVLLERSRETIRAGLTVDDV